MPTPKKGPRLGSNPAHQKLMLSNLAVSLFENERIKTTEAKAKMLRPFAEKLITKAKKGDLHNRRLVLSTIEDREIVHKLFDDIAPRFTDRNGGYTRILKIGPRNGDGAPMVLIELVEEGRSVATTVETPEGKKRRLARPGTRRRKDETESPAATDASSDEAVEDDAADDEAQAEPELQLEAEEAAAEAEVEASEEAAEAATDEAEAEVAQAQADGDDAPDAGGEGVKDQK